jgi:hypothetical protein
VTPAPQLTDPTCCVTPPLICGSKGTRETQVTTKILHYSKQCCGSGSTCFWPSGSTSQRYGSGSGSCYHAKIVRILFLLFCDSF